MKLTLSHPKASDTIHTPKEHGMTPQGRAEVLEFLHSQPRSDLMLWTIVQILNTPLY